MAEEICIYMIIWAVFITASILAEEKGHVAATLIVERFSMKTRRYLAVFNGAVAFAFCVAVSILGFKIVSAAYINDERSLSALRFPVWLPYLSVAAGCTLVALRYAIRVYRLVFSFHIPRLDHVCVGHRIAPVLASPARPHPQTPSLR